MADLNANQIKPLKLKLQNILSASEIEQLDIVRSGEILKEGATYRDLMDADAEPFVAHARRKARADEWLIAKHDTPFEVWNKVKGRFIQ